MKWSDLKHLYNLFDKGETDKYFIKTSIGKRLNEMGLITVPEKSVIRKLNGYDEIFKSRYYKDFLFALELINKYDLYNINFTLEEFKALKEIEADKDTISNNITLKEISSIYFKSAKKIKNGTKLHKAILSVLNVDSLAEDEHDQQYLWVLHCKSKSPTNIVICENKNLLTKRRLNKTELWYAGGKNITKLKYVNIPGIPVYYFCDWDNDGIETYYNVKKIVKNVEIIVPKEPIKYKSTKNHIKWRIKIKHNLLSDEASKLLEYLINNDKWIEEESIKLEFE